jgi:tetratricopeptide (TPR) repeat protein
VGELAEARVAFDRGLSLAQSNPALIVEEAVMQRGIGLLLHHAKDHEGALRHIRLGIPVFRAINDQLQLLRSRLLEGFVEYNRGGNEIALHIFEETAELSRELGDHETRARSYANAAHSARRLGLRDRALAHFTTAAELLQQCGLTAETIRAQWGFTLLEAGDDPAAIIPALDRIRDQFLATGRKIDAAWVSLDVVMLLRDAGRHEEASRLAISLIEFFTKHGLPEEAMRALKELRLAAEEGNLTTELLEEIQQRLLKV